MYDQFSKTIQAGQTAAPSTSPIPASSTIAPMFAAAAQAPYFGAAASGAHAQGNLNDAGAAQAASARAEQIQKRLLQIKDLQDPKKYQIVQKEDGGFDYLDPFNKPITLHDYSRITGESPDKILSKSNNNLDKQYVNDFDNLQNLTNALATNDSKAINKLAIQIYGDNNLAPDDKANKAALAKVQTLKKMKPDDLIKAFTKFYPNVYSNLPWNALPSGTSQLHTPNQTPGFGG